MPKRRAFLAGFLPAMVAGSAFAQDQRQRRIRTDNGAFMGGGMAVPSAPAPAIPSAQRTEIAPMPNSGWQAPPTPSSDPNAPRFSPGMISPTMPGRGLAQGNSQQSINDRLFRGPAAGAHLRIPMSW